MWFLLAQDSKPVSTPFHWALLIMLTWALDSSRDRAEILVWHIYDDEPLEDDEGSVVSSRDPYRCEAWVDDLLVKVMGLDYDGMQGVLTAAHNAEPDIGQGLLDGVRAKWLEDREDGEGYALAFGELERLEATLADAFLRKGQYLGVVLKWTYGELDNNTVPGEPGEGRRRPSVGAGDTKTVGSFCIVALVKPEAVGNPSEELLKEAMAAVVGSLTARVWEGTTSQRLMETGWGSKSHKPVSNTSHTRSWEVEFVSLDPSELEEWGVAVT